VATCHGNQWVQLVQIAWSDSFLDDG
jgi:hypothetical protein